jgi:nicotinic acid mononucleotide adenylyltransferase
VDISSTKVKENLYKNKEKVLELIIPEINDYIFRNSLYNK